MYLLNAMCRLVWLVAVVSYTENKPKLHIVHPVSGLLPLRDCILFCNKWIKWDQGQHTFFSGIKDLFIGAEWEDVLYLIWNFCFWVGCHWLQCWVLTKTGKTLKGERTHGGHQMYPECLRMYLTKWDIVILLRTLSKAHFRVNATL